MEEHKERTNSRHILVLGAVFLCLFMVGNASAITFPVDEAGISAYVKVSDSIDLHGAMENLLPHIAEVLEVNPTYFIVTVTNDDNQNTHLYVGADGWVISYYLGTEEVSRAVRWNLASDEDPTPEEVTSMTTLEEVISKTCDAAGVDYETIKSGIKFYDFEHPNADRMMFVVDMQSREGSNSFYIAIPPEVTLKESSCSHYINATSGATYINLDGNRVSSHSGSGKLALYVNYGISHVYRHTIKISNLDLTFGVI
jgi:hypothetical protein